MNKAEINPSSEKSLLITGAGGFLAGELIKQLLESTNYKIYALTSNKEKLIGRFEFDEKVSYYNKEEFINNKFPWKKINALVHCAFARGYRSNQEIAESLYFTNKLFMHAAENKVPGIINISSQGVYGQVNKSLWNENTPVAPDSIYGFAKYASELLSMNTRIISNNQTKITNLRLASLTGGKEGLKPEVVSKFVNKALKSETIKIIGGKQIFSYIDVRDAAAGIIALLSIDSRLWRDVYNLGSNERYSIVEIANSVAEVAKKYLTSPVGIEIEEKDISLEIGMDSSIFYKDTHWKPQYTMKDTIESLFEYFNHKTEVK